MSDAHVRDELVTMLIAGHETTATALAWAFERLVRHPAALERLREEAMAGDGDEYAAAVANETLRLRPPVWLVARRVARTFELDGHAIPPDVVLAPCPYLVNVREDLYPRATAFEPERQLGRAPDTYAWIPFGGGRRRCLGAAFAQLELRKVLTAVARRCELEAAEVAPERPARRAVVFAPSRGGRVVLRARAG